jgi:hypothetical protein
MIGGMDVGQSNRAPQAFRETSRAALYTFLVITSPFTITAIVLGAWELGKLTVGFVVGSEWPRLIGGLCFAAIGTRAFACWLNRHHVRRRPDA